MAEDKDFFQHLSGELLDFMDWVGTRFSDPQAREAILLDLGGEPSHAPATAAPTLPTDKLQAVKNYRDASHPSAEAAIEALADVASLLDEIAAQATAWTNSPVTGAEETGHALLSIAASNFFRLRFPRLFLLLEAVSTIEDLTSTYGPGNNNLVDVWDSLAALIGYVWQPGKSLEGLAFGPDARPERLEAGVDFLVRVAAIILGGLGVKNDINPVRDVMTGWDAPGIDLDSSDPVSRADVVSARMTSISFGADTIRPSTVPSAKGRVQLSTAMLHAVEGGPAVFLALGGNTDIEEKLGDRWTFSFKARADAAVALLLAFDRFEVSPSSGDFEFSVGYAANPPKASPTDTGVSDKTFTLRLVGNTRIDIGNLAFTLSLASTTGAEALVRIGDSALVLDPSDHDGALAEFMGKTPLRLPFGVVFGYSSTRGLVREFLLPQAGASAQPAPLTGPGNVGAPGWAVTIPIGRAIGPVTVHELGLRLSHGPADAPPQQQTQTTVELDTSFSAQIGPVYFRIDQLGLEFIFDTKSGQDSNLRLFDNRFGTKFPRGVTVNVKAGCVEGGGSILHDPDQGIYFGTFDLAVRDLMMTIQAICLVATKNADGTKGFSMVAIVTVEQPWYLGMGFTLEGFGGLLAVHRTFDENAVRAALPTGQLRNVLFPSDPVHHTAEIQRALQTLFPAQHGSYLFGLLAKISWGTPTLIRFELGVLYQWGLQHRLIILGRVSAVLPHLDLPILTLNMDAVGVLDFDAGTLALDAVLYDSKICGRFVLTGAMAMRMGWKDTGPGFALAVGGLHPKFNAPAGFPSVARLQLALTNGDNPKLICQAYFAHTSNTVQFGADCSLYAAAYGFSITGDVGFDVLIQILPFHFLAEFRASVQLKRGSDNLFKISLDGGLEGPLPLRIFGKATFEILWCDVSVPIDRTLVGGDTPDDVPLVDVLSLLVDALSDPHGWQPQLPAGSSQLVTLRQPVTDGVLLHPLGTLTVRQTVVPLGLTRDIDRVGTSRPSGERRFTVTNPTIGSHTQTPNSIRELFAPGQFFDLSDDDRLAAPSFEPMGAGVTFGATGYTSGPGQASEFDYTDITIGPDGNPVPPAPGAPPYKQPHILDLMPLSPAARAPVRHLLTQRFAAPVHPAAPSVNVDGWAAVDLHDTTPPAVYPTWIEARAHIDDAAQFLLVPASALAAP